MTNAPLRIAQTSKEAQRQYKKHGPRLPDRQRAQLERAAELELRAARIRENDEKRRVAKRRREEKEEKERNARRQLGISLATQTVGFSHSQAQMKKGMEAFLGFKKMAQRNEMRDTELNKKLEKIVEDTAREPWEDSDEELPDVDLSAQELWKFDELDDDILFEAMEKATSDAVEEPQDELPRLLPPPIPAPTALQKSEKPKKDDADFIRLHGPINKTLESILERLPDPLIELLSQDVPSNLEIWNPAVSLLHKLNPVELPPHRLRLKVGCIVRLLRDLNTSSQLSKSCHLHIIRFDKERLECLVLDGQLKGTRTLLTRVPLTGYHRNDTRYAFQRIQYPIKLSTDYTCTEPLPSMASTSFKLPSVSGQVSKPVISSMRNPPAKPKIPPPSSPSFKLPGLPASKSTNSPAPPVVQALSTSILDGWDDFLDSGTQIARELSSATSSASEPHVAAVSSSTTLLTQDFDFSMELDDMEDLSELVDAIQTQPGPQAPKADGLVPTKPQSSREPSGSYCNGSTVNTIMPPPKLPSESPSLKRKMSHETMDVKAFTTKSTIAPVGRANPLIKKQPTTVSSGSFSDFGLSTQDVTSLLDDDESMIFSSAEISV